MTDLKDPVALTQALIKCQSVTPFEGGALTLLEGWLQELGFDCHRLKFQDENTPDVENLFAIRRIKGTKNLCFAGHTDVVPAGPLKSWVSQPFAAHIKQDPNHQDHIVGRGAVDMKGAIACFIAAIARHIEHKDTPSQTLSFLITGDEEDVAINGTKKVLKWLEEQNIPLDFCLVGEPSSIHKVGDTIKVGRRGSLNTKLTLKGKQGHVAFPEKSNNPVPFLIEILNELKGGPIEGKSDYFDASNLEITTIDIGNPTTNLIPEAVSCGFNIRFNDLHTGKSLSEWIQNTVSNAIKDSGIKATFDFEFSGEAEFIEKSPFTDALSSAIQSVTTLKTDLSTAGATSDARFIRHHCPVMEFGLVGETMHQVNEAVSLDDLETLTKIYQEFLVKMPALD